MKYLLFLALIGAYFCPQSAINHKDCGSKIGDLLNVTVSNCEGKEICPLNRGRNATIEVTFTTNSTVEKVKSKIQGVLGAIHLPFTNPRSNGCLDSGLSCPLIAGETYVYQSYVEVKKWYPPITIGVKWELQNENHTNIVCLLIPSQVV